MRLRRLKVPAFLPVATLWEDRFRSVLVERKGQALRAMAAYIDLNPVRAKICDDPKDYRWCGYAEAVAGGKEAREAVASPMRGLAGETKEDRLFNFRQLRTGVFG